MKPNWTPLCSLLLLVGCHLSLSAQSEFVRADSIAANFKESYTNVEELAQKLSAELHTDREKARVFFMWLAHNVRYDCRKYHEKDREPELAVDIVQKTIKARRGICGDYSLVFAALCKQAGLEAVVVSGDSRDFSKPYRNKHDNPHGWNAVKLDGQWQLLDATWAAGYTDKKVTKFTREVKPGYFLVRPDLFRQNHLPADPRWQLMDVPLTEEEFPSQPLINYGQTDFIITDFAPAVADSGQKKYDKEIWFKFVRSPHELLVTNRRGKPIKFQRSVRDDQVVLSFSGASVRSIEVYGGKTGRRMTRLAAYEL